MMCSKKLQIGVHNPPLRPTAFRLRPLFESLVPPINAFQNRIQIAIGKSEAWCAGHRHLNLSKLIGI